MVGNIHWWLRFVNKKIWSKISHIRGVQICPWMGALHKKWTSSRRCPEKNLNVTKKSSWYQLTWTVARQRGIWVCVSNNFRIRCCRERATEKYTIHNFAFKPYFQLPEITRSKFKFKKVRWETEREPSNGYCLNAMIITEKKSTSSTDTDPIIKADSGFQAIRIRQTQKGGLLFELSSEKSKINDL